jgi:transcriptional regulator with XRE-family HTH domain
MKTPTPQQAIALLLNSGCTQASIAKAAHVNQATISRILRGNHTNIRHDTALRILEVHRLTLGTHDNTGE